MKTTIRELIGPRDENICIDIEKSKWTEGEFLVDIYSYAFEQSNNPVYAVECFMHARKYEIDIPDPVLVWLEESFEDFMVSGYTKSIDKCMGLRATGGVCTAYKKTLKNANKFQLLRSVYLIKRIFKLSTIDAAEISHDVYRVGYMSADSLADYYNRADVNRLKLFGNEDGLIDEFSREDKLEYLNTLSNSFAVKKAIDSLQ